MTKNVTRAAIGLAVATAAVGLSVTPAGAAVTDPHTGLTFYSGSFATPVLNVAHPDGACTALPASADSLVGWSDVTAVHAYAGADCTGAAVGLGTLRTFRAGEFAAFRAS
ncbi:hypothetical protein [Actinoplanes sp. HUAS TT8]|uniref:hypothetical protein n=1 Tax=Actinoplanes sp. HUAS TT8 TaxID=3447453 RepID=UPI003F51C6AF